MSLSESDISRIIEMAWEDRTPFDAIEVQFNLSHDDVVNLIRKYLKKKIRLSSQLIIEYKK